jgi:Polymer-forming cytoskeletal
MAAQTQPALEIHPGIMLKGRLSMVKDVVLTGKFEGELETLGCLTVASGGEVTGSIDAGALVLEPGNRVAARVKVAPPSAESLRAFSEEKKTSESLWAAGFRKLKAFALGRK